ncbi:MAG: hypothetical protein HYT98_00775 [Candidatus Sungbacteria bacterium]|nr:hypothetical protein [Candidatus Sungbacteria bacterium]
MIKIILAAIVILSIMGIANAGVFAMDHGSDNSHKGCIASAAKGIDCPEDTVSLVFLNFHFDALKSILTATFAKNLLGILAAFLMSVLTFWIFGAGNFWHSPALIGIYSNRHLSEWPVSSRHRKFIRWLALHENSPSFFKAPG